MNGRKILYKSGMNRDSQDNKPRYDLIVGKTQKDDMHKRWAVLMTLGVQLYGERNWEKADSQEELERAIASAARHFNQWLRGETDEDHAAACFFNINLAEYIKEKLQHKTREKTIPPDPKKRV